MLQIRSRFGYGAAVIALCCSGALAQGAGVLRVGTSGDYNPFSFHDATGTLTGFDVVVANRLAADIGRHVEFVPFRWPELVQQLDAGAFDIAMSGVTVRADRAVHMLFTRPYAITGAVAVIRKGGRRYRRGELDRATRRIAVNGGGHLEQAARLQFPHAHLVTVADNSTLPELLRRGQADAAVSEGFEARTWPAAEFTVLDAFTRDRKVYALPRGNAELLRQVNEWLAAREADGWLNQQRRRWFGARAEQPPQQAGFEALVAAMDLRLQLMPFVAAVKRRDHLPIEDPQQEARVLDRVRAASTDAGLNADDMEALFREQMDLAKAVEQGSAAEPIAELSDLRTALAGLSGQIIAEVGHCHAWLADARYRQLLDRTVRDGFTAAGLPNAKLRRLITLLARMRAVEPHTETSHAE